jgi:hypothetical protein
MALPLVAGLRVENGGVTSEYLLHRRWIQLLENEADRAVGRRAPPIRVVSLASKLLDVLVLHRAGHREDQPFFRARLRRDAHLSKDPAKAPDSVSREDRPEIIAVSDVPSDQRNEPLVLRSPPRQFFRHEKRGRSSCSDRHDVEARALQRLASAAASAQREQTPKS